LLAVALRAYKRNGWSGGSRFVTNRAPTSLGAGSGEQKPQSYQCNKSEKPSAAKHLKFVACLHVISPCAVSTGCRGANHSCSAESNGERIKRGKDQVKPQPIEETSDSFFST
jgi:hypothetical protein